MTAQAEQKGSNATKLCNANLEQISQRAEVPQYDRDAVTCGIMHMSVGGFHRSHQALYIDDALNAGATEWGICGVGLLPQDKDNIQALADQEGLYTVLERNAKADTARIIGSMKEVMHAPSNPQAVLDRMINPAIKILSLTITEKGYYYDPQGNLNTEHPAVKNDLDLSNTPQTVYGYIAQALQQRNAQNIPAFTIMSCDNLPGNGHLTQRLVLEFINLVDTELAQWVKENVSFPNAMVDRITPVTTTPIVQIVNSQFLIDDAWPVICEDFKQWVLEDNFSNGRPPLDTVGVQLVADVEPYEKMKVRLLNGSHSALSYLSYLMGYREVDTAMADPLISKFVRSYMDSDVTPSVPNVPGIDLDAYKDKLIERFSNPAISDQVQRLAEDGSTKIPNAILPCISYQLKNDGSIKFAALALAGWFKYLTAIDEDSNAIEINDPRAEQLTSAITANPQDPTQILAISDVFGTKLPANADFLKALNAAMKSLHNHGAKATIQAYLG